MFVSFCCFVPLQLPLHCEVQVWWLHHPWCIGWTMKGARRHLWSVSLDGWKSIQGYDPSSPHDRKGDQQDWWVGETTFEVVMHNFMWVLIEEQASDRAHQHQARNQDSGHDIWVVESEAHDISQSIINHALWPGWPTVCEYVKGQSLTVNVLWEVVYGVCKEVLHLDSLEDFSATEVDLMDLKNNILAMWESRDRCRTLSLRPTFTPLSVGASKKRSTLGDTFTPSKAMASASILHSSDHGLGEMPSPPPKALRPTSRDPISLDAYVLQAKNLPHFEILYGGFNHGVQLWSYDGTTLVTVDLK